MANTIRNLPEFIEPESQYELALKARRKALPQFSLLGPPDMCYLTKDFHRSLNISFNKPASFGFYHFNYGLCPSTPAAVSAYITKLLKEQEGETNWFSNGKWVISKACYCMFDAFTRCDVYLEIMFPGGMRLYGVLPNEEICQIDEKAWETAYISSVLRAMQPEKLPMIKLHREFQRVEDLENFFQVVLNSLERLDLPIEPFELLAVRGNKLLNIICDYMNRKRRYQLSLKFFNYLVELNPHNVVFLSAIFNSIGNNLDTIKLIAPLLNKTPHVFTMIYQEAHSLLQLKRYDLAGKLSRSLIQMIPESFEAWMLLIEVYLSSKNYEATLLTLNIAPLNQKKQSNNGYCYPSEDKILEGGVLSEPKEKGDSDYFFFNIEVDTPDFRYTKMNDEFKYIQQDYVEINRKKEQELSSLPATRLQEQELQLYKVLVRIEREISWEKLLLLRAKLFLMDENSSNPSNIANSLIGNSSLNNSRKDQSTSASLLMSKAVNLKSQIAIYEKKVEDYEIYDEKMMEESALNNAASSQEITKQPMGQTGFEVSGSKSAQKTIDILNKKKAASALETNQESFNETDEDDSDKEHELPSFLKPEEEQKQPARPIIPINSKKDDLSEEMSQSQAPNIQPVSLDDRLSVPVKPVKLGEKIEALARRKQEMEENESQLHSHELSIRNMTKKPWIEGVAFENPLLDFSKKRLCSKVTDSLFEALYEDLNALYEWSQEEYTKQTKHKRKKPSSDDDDDDDNKDDEEEEEYIEDLKISGKLWVYRGILAQRLLRSRFAETAYRKAVERGFSLYAWRQLLGTYLEIENFKASLVCIAEILDELENEGVENFVFLPKWIEEAILQIISRAGYKGLTNLLSELNLDDPSINELIKEAAYWKVEGSGNV